MSSGCNQLDGMSPNEPSYCLSKLALNGLTIMLGRRAYWLIHLRQLHVPRLGAARDAGGQNATRSVEEGADTAVWLADEAPHELTGKFFRDRREIGRPARLSRKGSPYPVLEGNELEQFPACSVL